MTSVVTSRTSSGSYTVPSTPSLSHGSLSNPGAQAGVLGSLIGLVESKRDPGGGDLKKISDFLSASSILPGKKVFGGSSRSAEGSHVLGGTLGSSGSHVFGGSSGSSGNKIFGEFLSSKAGKGFGGSSSSGGSQVFGGSLDSVGKKVFVESLGSAGKKVVGGSSDSGRTTGYSGSLGSAGQKAFGGSLVPAGKIFGGSLSSAGKKFFGGSLGSAGKIFSGSSGSGGNTGYGGSLTSAGKNVFGGSSGSAGGKAFGGSSRSAGRTVFGGSTRGGTTKVFGGSSGSGAGAPFFVGSSGPTGGGGGAGLYQGGHGERKRQGGRPLAPVVPILVDEREGPTNGFYNFIFETGDEIQRQERGTPLEDTGAVASQGSWSFVFPDGTPAIFRFLADETGYHVESPLLPTPPPMPAHALAQIEKARLEDAAAAAKGSSGGIYQKAVGAGRLNQFTSSQHVFGSSFSSSSGSSSAASSTPPGRSQPQVSRQFTKPGTGYGTPL